MDKSLIKVRHDRSKKDFPGLKLEDDEYVEFAIKRAKICLMMIWGGTAVGLILVLVGFLFVLMGQNMIDAMGLNFLFIILAFKKFKTISVIFFILVFITYIYDNILNSCV